MRNFKKYVAAALLLALTAGTANAAGIRFDFGNVAIGYSDGYYDNGHHWHSWRHRSDLRTWQRDHQDNYHGWRHNDRRHH